MRTCGNGAAALDDEAAGHAADVFDCVAVEEPPSCVRIVPGKAIEAEGGGAHGDEGVSEGNLQGLLAAVHERGVSAHEPRAALDYLGRVVSVARDQCGI